MFTLQTRDFLKGLIVSVLTSVCVVIQNSISAGTLTFNWNAIGIAALGSAVAYLLKNLFTNDKIVAEKTLQQVADKKGESFSITPTKKY